MRCNRHGCDKEAVTMHGVTMVVCGYCEDHRCCARCGWWVNDCTCMQGVTERPEYIAWKRDRISEKIEALQKQARGLTPPNGNPAMRLCSTCDRVWDDPDASTCSNSFHLKQWR